MNHTNKYLNEFLRIFDSLCVNHNRWDAWSDFVTMTAINISNTTDSANAPTREETYRSLAAKYTSHENDLMAKMLAQLVCTLDENPNQDFLGKFYMDCKFGDTRAGQFFTPYNVCKMMSEMNFGSLEFEQESFVSVNDPTCGSCAILIAFANVCKEHNIDYHQKVLFVGQDIDRIVALMGYIQLSLLGCAGYVIVGDSLAEPAVSYDEKGLLPAVNKENVWYTPMFSSATWSIRKEFAKLGLYFH